MPHQPRNAGSWLEIPKALGLLALIGYLDRLMGFEKSFFIFYLIPIVFTYKRLGLFFSVGMGMLSALVWLVSNMLAGEKFHDWVTPLWNTTIRLAVFLLVIALIAARGKLQKEIRKSATALDREILERSRLERELLGATEREQRRIGHDLHDGLCQHLTATALAGKVLAKKLAGQSNPETEAADCLVDMVEKGIELTRSLARGLHPIELHAEGLVDALRALAANTSKGFHVACKLECTQTVSLATEDANMHLYRIAQEAISNAIRHGRAKNITLDLDDNGSDITLTITDDGFGLSADAWTKNGMGLQIMRYRAGMIGADFNIERLPNRGTRVTCRLSESASIVADSHAR